MPGAISAARCNAERRCPDNPVVERAPWTGARNGTKGHLQMSITPALKIALGAAGVGLVGGVVAERMTSGDSIKKNREAEVWNRLHDDFLKRHPTPDGVNLKVRSTPAWQNAAIAGGAAAGVAALGGGVAFAATKLRPQNFPMFVAGLSLAALGGAAALGVGASWAVR